MSHGRRLWLAVIALAAVAAAGARIAGQPFGEQPAKLTVLTVAPGLHVLNNEIAPGNATALVTDEGVVLIDDKFDVDHDTIMGSLQSLTTRPLRYIINTHHHADHSGGNTRMLRLGIPVLASEQARRNMHGTPRDGMFIDKQPGFPTITIPERATIHLGGTRAELYYFGRGHTDGDIVVHLPDHGAIVMGDLLTFGAATPQLIDYAGGGSAKAWVRTLDEVLRLEFDAVIPGHGGIATRDDLRRFRDDAARLSRRVHEMVLEKGDRAAIAKMLEAEFGWFPFLIGRAIDGLIAEHQ